MRASGPLGQSKDEFMQQNDTAQCALYMATWRLPCSFDTLYTTVHLLSWPGTLVGIEF